MSGRYWVRPMIVVLIGLVCLCAHQCEHLATKPGVPKATPERPATVKLTPRPTATPMSESAPASTPRAWGEVLVPNTPTSTLEPRPTEEARAVTLTVVYDNNPYDPRLRTAWGFGCLIQQGETTILFDTGGDGQMLLANMTALGLDPHTVELVVLSHIHDDHTGGLDALLKVNPDVVVYVPQAFPVTFKEQVRSRQVRLVEITGPTEIRPGLWSTGQMSAGIVEQALVIKTEQGLAVITGCAHPGVVEMVRQAREIGKDEVYLVLGGFHLDGASETAIQKIIANFRQMGVRKVAPCHCTGERAMGMFAAEYGEDHVRCGAGLAVPVEK